MDYLHLLNIKSKVRNLKNKKLCPQCFNLYITRDLNNSRDLIKFAGNKCQYTSFSEVDHTCKGCYSKSRNKSMKTT